MNIYNVLYIPFAKTNHKNLCIVYVHGSKKIYWEPGEGGDFHMKVDEIFVASLRIDHDGNHYDMFTHRS